MHTLTLRICAALAVAFVAILLAQLPYSPVHGVLENALFDKGTCKSDPDAGTNLQPELLPYECYFSDTYFQAREKFLTYAKAVNAEMRSFVIYDDPKLGPLSMDVAIVRGTVNSLLWHMSGTHGSEGFAGSAIQSAMLHNLTLTRKDTTLALPTLVFVHAVNPFGFANDRRVNEDNVDLNRNFLTDAQFEAVLKRDPDIGKYVTLDSFLNPTKMYSEHLLLNDILSWAVSLRTIAVKGLHTLKVALVSGNYHKPNGVGFGGLKRTASVNTLISLAHELFPTYWTKKVVMIDVHTGLGPSGVDTLLLDNAEQAKGVEKIFPVEMKEVTWELGPVKYTRKVPTGGLNDYLHGGDQAAAGYDLTQGMTSNFCEIWLAPHLAGLQRMCISQEFGTVSPAMVGTSMVQENTAFYYGNSVQRATYSARYRGCFYVQTRAWKRNVVSRGLTAATQALTHLVK